MSPLFRDGSRRDLGKVLAAGGLFAVLYPLGMPGYDVPGLPFVCLVPFFFLSVTAATPRQAAYRGFLAGVAANLLLYYWIAYTVAVQGKLGWTLGGLSALFVSAYIAVFLSAAAYLFNRFHRTFGGAAAWAFPVAWVCVEYARFVVFPGFPWLLLGYGISGHLLLRQAADVAGILGLGFLVAAVNAGLFRAAGFIASREYRRALFPVAASAAVVAFLAVYGSVREAGLAENGQTPPVRVAIAQGGIDQSVKWDPAYQRTTVTIYGELTREAAKRGPDVIIWPETAAPFFYVWEAELSREVDGIAAAAGVPLIFGAPWFDPAEGGKYYNSVFVLDAQGVPRARYDKRRLVPFGEYIPLRSALFFLRKLTAGEEDFSAGTGPSLFRVRGTVASASVCYEAVFPDIIRDGVRSGAGWLVNVTNDAWFGDTVAPHQHLAMARMRCVEFRRPMARAANSGISAVIDARGEIGARLGLFRRGTLAAEIAPGSGETLYAKTGELFGILCTIMAFSILFVSLRGTDGHRTSAR